MKSAVAKCDTETRTKDLGWQLADRSTAFCNSCALRRHQPDAHHEPCFLPCGTRKLAPIASCPSPPAWLQGDLQHNKTTTYHPGLPESGLASVLTGGSAASSTAVSRPSCYSVTETCRLGAAQCLQDHVGCAAQVCAGWAHLLGLKMLPAGTAAWPPGPFPDQTCWDAGKLWP